MIEIPKLEDAELARRQALHLPVVQGDKGKFLTVLEHDIKHVSYPWIDELGPAVELGPLVGSALTLHSYSYAGFFKPSVAEVLRQLPDALVNVPTWFLVRGPSSVEDFYSSLESKADALVREMLELPPDESVRKAFEAGFHTARTLFFQR